MQISSQPVKGMRDFLPQDSALRDYVKSQILDTYRQSGFHQIETPVMENIDILEGGDGGENLKMLFKILKRGDKLHLDRPHENENELVDYGMRFDLTLPLTRFYAHHQAQLPSPFKSIQMGYVWRAERAQKGRYRQFMQCDIDVIGSASHAVEIELIHVTSSALLNLGFKDFSIKINDRHVLERLVLHCGFPEESVSSVLISLDKIDKIGQAGVLKELNNQGFEPTSVAAMETLLSAYLSNEITLENLTSHISGIDEAVLTQLQEIIETVSDLSSGSVKVEFDLSLVRGMGYYTGPIFEIALNEGGLSLGGGGRYDNMVGKFFKGRSVPACGFSIGFERIINVLQEQGFCAPTEHKKLALLYAADAQKKLTGLFQKAAQLRDEYHCVSVEPRLKNTRLQLETLEKTGFTHFAIYNENDNIEVKSFSA